jgi:hypothetical protein
MKRHKRTYILLAFLIASALLFMGLNTNNQRGVANQAYTFTGNYPTSGNYIFVDNTSSNAQDSYPRNGGSWDAPLNTIDYAIGRCTASDGCVILVSPGHAENLATESGIDLDVPGTRLVGLGTGRNRPVITWTNASGMLEVNAHDTSIENFILDMSFLNGAHTGVSIASGTSWFTFKDNDVILTDIGQGKVGHAFYMTGGTNSVIDNCRFTSGLTEAGTVATRSSVTEVIFLGSAVNDVEIKDTYIQAYNASKLTGLIQAPTSRVSGFYIHDSSFLQGNSGASVINLSVVGLSSDVVIRNISTHVGGPSGTTSSVYHDSISGPPYDNMP